MLGYMRKSIHRLLLLMWYFPRFYSQSFAVHHVYSTHYPDFISFIESSIHTFSSLSIFLPNDISSIINLRGALQYRFRGF